MPREPGASLALPFLGNEQRDALDVSNLRSSLT